MKGLFIPEVTAEMFRNGCLESIEALMAEGEIEDIEYSPWIPISERLPENGENILFSTKTDRVFEGKYFEDNTDCRWYAYRDDGFAHNNTVIAWMPLPEPYKAESEE